MRVVRYGFLAAVLLAAVATAGPREGDRPRPFHFAGPDLPIRLLLLPEVQRELRMDSGQIERVRQLSLEMRERALALFRELPSLSDEERRARFAAFRAEQERRLDDILRHRQERRLRQLELQVLGLRALMREDVADELRLTPEQRQRVRSALDEERDALRAAFQGIRRHEVMDEEQRQETRRRFEEIRAATEARLNAILTEEQRRQFQAMQGRPFAFPERRRP